MNCSANPFRLAWLPRLVLACLAAVLSTPLTAQAADNTQPAPATAQPKICLVLSGGGARGAAHVGVIKVLEEHRVPVHCVVGTSMGSLVGGAYATGTSVAEMDDILRQITTELLFREKPPRQQRIMRRKMDDYTILFSPEIGVSSDGLKMSKGLVSGVQLETVLRKLARAKGYYRFDNLPIPYRAVATDLVTGQAVVFDKGDLALVMRASMSVPGAVAPAEFGGMILVDGMLTSNLPVETARAMGADVIIAVNVGTPLLKRDEITGIVGVSGQMLSILTEQNVQKSLAALGPRDVLISPELGDYSTGDFDNLPAISVLGEEAARKVVNQLAALSIPERDYAELRQRQQVVLEADTRAVDEIRFAGLKRVNPDYARNFMETETGKPIDQATLDSDLRRIYGTGDFEHVSYRYLDEEDRRVLEVEVAEKDWGPDYLRFGLGLSSDFTGDAHFNLLASYRQTWLNTLGAEWRNDVQFGRTSAIRSEFYQPLDPRSYFFVAPYVEFERSTTTLYREDDRIADYDVYTSLAGMYLGSQFYRYGEMRLGVAGGVVEPELDTGPEALSPGIDSIRQGAYILRLVFDQIDSVSFPRSGWRGSAEIYDSNSDLGAEETYTRWDLGVLAAHSLGEHTLQLATGGGGQLGDDALPRYGQFQWGGFLRQSGYATDQLIADSFEYGRILYTHRISRSSLLDGAYGGISLEMTNLGEPLVPGNIHGELRSVGLFLGTDSPLGPVYLGYGRAEDGNSAFYFYLGNPY